jgi:hypothetical protein
LLAEWQLGATQFPLAGGRLLPLQILHSSYQPIVLHLIAAHPIIICQGFSETPEHMLSVGCPRVAFDG